MDSDIKNKLNKKYNLSEKDIEIIKKGDIINFIPFKEALI